VEQPVHRLTWAISTAMNLICKGYDVGNAFAEAPTAGTTNISILYETGRTVLTMVGGAFRKGSDP
jgi:hypothetical protein